MSFLPTQEWVADICKSLSGLAKAPPELSITATEAPRELGGEITLLFKFDAGKCVEAKLLRGRFYATYALSARYEDLLKILEGRLSPFAAVPLGKLKIERGNLSELAEYMPLALEVIEAARNAARRSAR